MHASLGFDVNDLWFPILKRSPGANELLLGHQSTIPQAQVSCPMVLVNSLPSINPEVTNRNRLPSDSQMNYVSIAFSPEAQKFIPLFRLMLSIHKLQPYFISTLQQILSFSSRSKISAWVLQWWSTRTYFEV